MTNTCVYGSTNAQGVQHCFATLALSQDPLLKGGEAFGADGELDVLVDGLRGVIGVTNECYTSLRMNKSCELFFRLLPARCD
jgi:hypothetical protein